MDIRDQRLAIFKQVESGELTLEEASRLLENLEKYGVPAGPELESVGAEVSQAAAGMPAQPVILPAAAAPDPIPAAPQFQAEEPAAVSQPEVIEVENLHSNGAGSTSAEQTLPAQRGNWWLLVFVPGLLLSVAAVTWMLEGFRAAGLSWGFWLSFIPFAVGVVMLWLGWEIRLARWFHLHIHQREGARPSDITIRFPLPTGLISWAIRTFGHFGSPVAGKDVSKDGPVHIAVEGVHGEQIEIWIDGPRR